MSGQATININDIRKAGIYGFLETPPEKKSEKTASVDRLQYLQMR
jgi:hypothetical protein